MPLANTRTVQLHHHDVVPAGIRTHRRTPRRVAHTRHVHVPVRIHRHPVAIVKAAATVKAMPLIVTEIVKLYHDDVTVTAAMRILRRRTPRRIAHTRHVNIPGSVEGYAKTVIIIVCRTEESIPLENTKTVQFHYRYIPVSGIRVFRHTPFSIAHAGNINIAVSVQRNSIGCIVISGSIKGVPLICGIYDEGMVPVIFAECKSYRVVLMLCERDIDAELPAFYLLPCQGSRYGEVSSVRRMFEFQPPVFLYFRIGIVSHPYPAGVRPGRNAIDALQRAVIVPVLDCYTVPYFRIRHLRERRSALFRALPCPLFASVRNDRRNFSRADKLLRQEVTHARDMDFLGAEPHDVFSRPELQKVIRGDCLTPSVTTGKNEKHKGKKQA